MNLTLRSRKMDYAADLDADIKKWLADHPQAPLYSRRTARSTMAGSRRATGH
jgi:hypothetical protein